MSAATCSCLRRTVLGCATAVVAPWGFAAGRLRSRPHLWRCEASPKPPFAPGLPDDVAGARPGEAAGLVDEAALSGGSASFREGALQKSCHGVPGGLGQERFQGAPVRGLLDGRVRPRCGRPAGARSGRREPTLNDSFRGHRLCHRRSRRRNRTAPGSEVVEAIDGPHSDMLIQTQRESLKQA